MKKNNRVRFSIPCVIASCNIPLLVRNSILKTSFSSLDIEDYKIFNSCKKANNDLFISFVVSLDDYDFQKLLNICNYLGSSTISSCLSYVVFRGVSPLLSGGSSSTPTSGKRG